MGGQANERDLESVQIVSKKVGPTDFYGEAEADGIYTTDETDKLFVQGDFESL